jgi:hypothetical protein
VGPPKADDWQVCLWAKPLSFAKLTFWSLPRSISVWRFVRGPQSRPEVAIDSSNSRNDELRIKRRDLRGKGTADTYQRIRESFLARPSECLPARNKTLPPLLSVSFMKRLSLYCYRRTKLAKNMDMYASDQYGSYYCRHCLGHYHERIPQLY